jgi:hypothetical protein
MAHCIIQIKDEVNCKLVGLELATRKKLVDRFKYEIPGARYQPSVRLGRWDGKVAFFQFLLLTPGINLKPIKDETRESIENMNSTRYMKFIIQYALKKTWRMFLLYNMICTQE